MVYVGKQYPLPITGSRNPTLLPTASWYLSHQGKHSTVKCWMEQHPTHTEKRQSKINFSSRCRSLLASGSLLAADTGLAQTLSMPQNKESHPLPIGYRYGCGVSQGSYDRHFSRTKEDILSLEQRKLFPHKP